ARKQQLHLEHIVVDSDRGRFTAHGDYVPRDNYRMDLAATALVPAAASASPLRRTMSLGVVARGDLEHLEIGVGGALPGQVRASLSLSGNDKPSWRLRASADKVDTALL